MVEAIDDASFSSCNLDLNSTILLRDPLNLRFQRDIATSRGVSASTVTTEAEIDSGVLARPVSVGEIQGVWWVACVKPKQEKLLAEELVERDVEYFLPLVSRNSIKYGIRKKIQSPLFPGYLFFAERPDGEARYKIKMTHRLVGSCVIEVRDQGRLINEMGAIEAAIRANSMLGLHRGIATGIRVRVTSGPFMGREGIIEQVGRRPVIVLRVSILGASTAMEIDPSIVEPV